LVQVRAEQAAEDVTNLAERKLTSLTSGSCHDMLRRILLIAVEETQPVRGGEKWFDKYATFEQQSRFAGSFRHLKASN
jgi:hypothetical protein